MTDYYYLYLFFTISFLSLDNNNSVALIVIIPGFCKFGIFIDYI